MKKLIIFLLALLSMMSVYAGDKTINLVGRVKDAVTKYDLTRAKVYLYDSKGEIADSVTANQSTWWRDQYRVDTLLVFYLAVPKVDSTHVIEVRSPGYKTLTFRYTLDKIAKREEYRELPPVFLERAPRELKEVTVTSTKIKFYNKGDTVVYNADAFELAEGSMLDALIAQLPGAELSTNGQIKVNGQFVESLLLNGKEFFDGNNNIMLENIAAYTVSNIQLYEGQSAEAKFKGDFMAPKVLTMDVRLKKEYNMGWIINAQAGYGTDDRYVGKLFANWFNATTRVTGIANMNNLNDNRKPGRTDTWTPEQMPDGTREYRSVGLNYAYDDVNDKFHSYGDVSFEQTIDKSHATSLRTNFLPGGDTYENSYSSSRNRETVVKFVEANRARFSKVFSGGVAIGGLYNDVKNTNSSVSGAFDEEQPDMSGEILDAIYSDGSDELLKSVLNRSRTRADGRRKSLMGSAQIFSNFAIPNTRHEFGLQVLGYYKSDKDYQWKDYDINYGADPVAAVTRRQYIDNTPNHIKRITATVDYRTMINRFSASIIYKYAFEEQVKNSSMFALERLEDMGIYGVLPEGYLSAFDPANSYNSRKLENTHTITPTLSYAVPGVLSQDDVVSMRFSGDLSFNHRNLNYWRNKQSYGLCTQNTSLSLRGYYSAMISYSFNSKGERQNRKFRNALRYSFMLDPTLPDLFDMVDIVDDSNPLNIYIGNPDLKMSVKQSHRIEWVYSPHSHTLRNQLSMAYTNTRRELVRGFTYDTQTGVRHNKMYNVDGSDGLFFANSLSWQFGAKKQFSLSSQTGFGQSHYSDMIGVDIQEPEPTKVTFRNASQNLRLSWQIGKQSLALRGDYTNRRTSSAQPGFNNLNANHYIYGLTGVFKLPAGFGISTDFTFYTRSGYGSSALDTTDPVWNMRVSYAPPRNSHWVILLDGFDMLHKLSNVNYAVSASGRLVSYTNALPRYFLLSVQYRLNIQPKRR
ncbi:MAG: outer membrane beta-barrel family protein [Muribaculaceae bacterium]|nr:outer membrane beta-barrel family protein [Muribaculaceae bacterium]